MELWSFNGPYYTTADGTASLRFCKSAESHGLGAQARVHIDVIARMLRLGTLSAGKAYATQTGKAEVF